MGPHEIGTTIGQRSGGNAGDSGAWLYRRRAGTSGRFLHSSGLAVEQIRDAAQEPRFLVGVLEHMLADESLLLAFATSVGVDPAAIGQARAALASNGERRLP
jgi:hypothetical protein